MYTQMSNLEKSPARPLLAPALRRHMERLYQQQMWVWGQDIRAPQGNLLKAYGFAYVSGQKAAGVERSSGHHSSLYTYTSTDHIEPLSLSLLSFGMGLSYQHLHLFTERYRLRWKQLAHHLPAEFSQLKHLPESHHLTREIDLRTRETAYRALQLGACVIRDYEQWVLQTQGEIWRILSLKKRPERSSTKAHQMAHAWDHLALQLHQTQR